MQHTRNNISKAMKSIIYQHQNNKAYQLLINFCRKVYKDDEFLQHQNKIFD